MSIHTRTGSTRWILAAALSILPCLAPGISSLHAAESPDADSDGRVRALEERVAALEARIRELLEALRSAGSTDAVELQRRIDLLAAELEKLRIGRAAGLEQPESVHGLGPAASRIYGLNRGLSIGGYGEFVYEDFPAEADDGSPSGETDTADLLRGVLYFGYKFSDRILFNSELEIEHASTGDGGEAALEFAYLDFLLTPAANIRTGLVLVPAGFINELHEPPIFLGANRPLVERLILPATWRENGIGLFGEKGPFTYRGYVLAGFDSSGFGASSALRGGRQAGSRSKAEDLGVTFRVDYTGVPGLLLGGFFYSGGADQGSDAPTAVTFDPNNGAVTGVSAAAPFDARITLYDLHAEYRARGMEFRALWAHGTLDDAAAVNDANGLDGTDSVGEEFQGWYAQAGYDVFSAFGKDDGQSLTPFVRYERFNTQEEVPDEAPVSRGGFETPFASDPANDQTITTFGVNYKPLFNVSIKLDWSNFKNEAGTGVDRLAFGVGYLF
jgi:hypothetical protein